MTCRQEIEQCHIHSPFVLYTCTWIPNKQAIEYMISKYVTWYWILHYIFVVFLFNSYACWTLKIILKKFLCKGILLLPSLSLTFAEVLVGESWGKPYSKLLLFFPLKNLYLMINLFLFLLHGRSQAHFTFSSFSTLIIS